jgi:hypothetical protein
MTYLFEMSQDSISVFRFFITFVVQFDEGDVWGIGEVGVDQPQPGIYAFSFEGATGDLLDLNNASGQFEKRKVVLDQVWYKGLVWQLLSRLVRFGIFSEGILNPFEIRVAHQRS